MKQKFETKQEVVPEKVYDLLVFIGRFSPLHKGHQEVIDKARTLSKQVLILVGSANSARSTRNPFTYEERKEMIESVYPDVIVRGIEDHTYNDTAWITDIQSTVHTILMLSTIKHGIDPQATADEVALKKIGLIGCDKDHSSYYLKMFPDWASENVPFSTKLSATFFREKLFSGDIPQRHEWAALMDVKIYDWLANFMLTLDYAKLKLEYQYLQNYRAHYGPGPFLTADSLVQVGGKILLIKRGKEYGHGLMAMPGGFVNENETFRNAALRELKEETNLRVPKPVLAGSIKSSKLFDDPHRSERARLVTECFHIKLENDTSLPEVRGGDDADEADWHDISWVLNNRQLFFEDHYHIIKYMLGLN